MALGEGRSSRRDCAPCHRPDGGGLIGPNLTDDYWLHGGRPTEILQTITDGVLDKGMPPWGKTLKPEQLTAVAAYVLSLHGTNPPNPKAPQGVTARASVRPRKRPPPSEDRAMNPLTPVPAEAPERVLPTLNRDGTRRWIRAQDSRAGRFWQRRRALAYGADRRVHR